MRSRGGGSHAAKDSAAIGAAVIPAWYTYHWYLVRDNELPGERDIKLAPGGYQWTDCLSYYAAYTYYHVSQLDPDGSAYVTVSRAEIEYEPHDIGSTTAYWGSTLGT